MDKVEVKIVSKDNYKDLSVMVGELLSEIMSTINQEAFNYDQQQTEQRAKNLIEADKYWVFIAWDTEKKIALGFISLYESYALYAEGAFGTIPELYVREEHRSKRIGNELLSKAIEFSLSKGWNRIEVTTPPLPDFDRTLNFYQKNNFEIAGGRKLKIDINKC